jgi:hypothetical protein
LTGQNDAYFSVFQKLAEGSRRNQENIDRLIKKLEATSLSMDRQLEVIPVGVMHEIYESALRNQGSIKSALGDLNSAIDAMQNATNELPDELSSSVNKQISSAVESASREIIKKHTEANVQAERAYEAYDKAVRWSFMRIFGVALVLFVVILAATIIGMIIVVERWLPDAREVQALRMEQAELERVVANLAQQGGRADLTTCKLNGKPRLCIRTDENVPTYDGSKGEKYRIIYGY